MNFLKSITAKTMASKDASLTQPKIISGKTTKKFTHAPSVVIKIGEFKGYLGTVYNTQSARYEIVITESEYVLVKNHGEHQVGETIRSEFGNAKIIERVPVTYNIMHSSGQILSYPENDLKRVIAYNSNGIIKLGALIGVTNKDGQIYYYVLPYKLNYSEKNLLQQLSSTLIKLRNHDAIIDRGELEAELSKLSLDGKEKTNYIQITADQLYKEFPETILITRGQDIGMYGKIKNILEERYLIQYPKFIVLSQNIVKTKSKPAVVGDEAIIQFGPYKNRRGIITNIFTERLTVAVDAARKTISYITVKENGKNISRPITSNDVLYIDIKLTNGNYFQVNKILENGNFLGIEFGSNVKELVEKEISSQQIESYSSGFKIQELYTRKGEEQKDEIAEEEMTQDFSETELLDTVEEPAMELNDEEEPVKEEFDIDSEGEGEELEFEEGKGQQFIEEESGEKYVSSFKDMERVAKVMPTLSKSEEEIRKKIEKIVLKYVSSGGDLNIYNIIPRAQNYITKIKEQVNNKFKNYWKESDEKYIIACVVLYEMIQSGNTYMIQGDTLDTYLTNLIRSNFFRKSDLKNSVFLMGEWTSVFTIDKSVLNVEPERLYKLMFLNCNAVIQSLTPANERLDLTKKIGVEEIEYIPIGVKKEIVRTIVYSKDVLSGNIPETAEKVIWGPLYQGIIQKYKMEISNKIANAKTQITKDVYNYVLNNLEQAPIELKNRKNNSKIQNKKVAEKGLERLKIVFDSMLEDIKTKQSDIEKERQESLLKEMEKLSSVSKVREEIELRKRLSKIGLEESEDEEDLDLQPKKKSKLFKR
jgi:hypothetical protein